MLVATAGACEYLHVSKPTLYRMVRRGEIPALKIGCQWRFRQESLERWTREQERKQRMSHTGA